MPTTPDGTSSDIAPSVAAKPAATDVTVILEKVDPYATVATVPGDAEGDFPLVTFDAGPRYRVLKLHARGGLGEVFLAQDCELNREVALKAIQERHADQSASRARFLLEAEVTGILEHPGIVPVYSLGQYPDGRQFYAMRFVRGESLKTAIECLHAANGKDRDPGERELEIRRLLGRFVDVCDAIAYAHSRGVLHRDIKPDNVMLGPFGEALVVDWGLAKRVGQADEAGGEEPGTSMAPGGAELTSPGSLIGTPQFMSPEQAEGKLDELGPASDIYSLGATLYCLLTGRPPFEGGDLKSITTRIVAGELLPPRRLLRSIPKGLEAICLKAMALRPGERYATARALADDVERWMADEPVSARRDRLPTRIVRWLRRRPMFLPWIAIFAIIDLTFVLDSARVQALLGQQVAVLKLSVKMLAVITVFLVQIHTLIGAVVGAAGGLFRDGVARGIERGAVRGFLFGFVLALLFMAIAGVALVYPRLLGFK